MEKEILKAGLEHPREEETAPTQSFFPAAFCFNLCRQPFLWSTKVRTYSMFPTTFMLGLLSEKP
ncbi:hypothetical protein Taro_023136 [Colocasia esculenta]|uniref:Uncharacterized protein n=1 Tax=Colocasia esculenta TaxID=4460 RepID=A0A843VDK8_COLES|nr:hypothetical protein [Colocasia esculenta]